ncbi:MAG: Epsin-3, clathrin recruitment and traffic between the Golgi and endosome [Trizodia sp. TS-e1964]|nr:MAG: Epsin-3, clathrin recruitment and traffic between the Golgi and endosome [Trizodia sp. TS-e1964]
MDLSSLKEQISSLNLYDIKAGVRKIQNTVMNYTEMEAKVREATNNEPWGASTTMMQEIANGTYNYQLLNEIMPMIYKRFTEKAAEEWRQIYKGLQLLEFLIKNGSERVIDDARSHLSLLKMLRQFHFIDLNGKDQGINVRNRAKELAELLSDVERIRAERKKARSTKNKYGGVEGGLGGMSGSMSGSSSKYGGFGSDDAGFGGYSGGVYGDGGGFGGASGGFQDNSTRRDRFEEYDEYDDGAVASPIRRSEASEPAFTINAGAKRAEPPKTKEPEVDLLFADDDPPTTISAPASKQPSAGSRISALQSGGVEDDDFDDFQSAEPAFQAQPKPSLPTIPGFPSTNQIASPRPLSGVQGANLQGMVGIASISPVPSNTTTPSNYSAFSAPAFNTPAVSQNQRQQEPPRAIPIIPQQQPRTTAFQPQQPNYYTSISVAPAQQNRPLGTSIPSSVTQAKPATSNSDAFGSLWSSASAGVRKTSTPLQGQGPKLADLAKQKSAAGIWGPPAASSAQQGQQQPSNQSYGGGLGDLLG